MKKKPLYIIGIPIGITLLAFAYYTISPLFINIKANDINPAINSTSSTTSVQPSAPVNVIGTTGHPASGTVRLVEADGKKYVRYENFKFINGPDIYVYLAKDLDAKEFVNIGRVRATEGNINYEIPAEVNVSDYPYVLTWCETFGVLFNSAKVF
jgi:Electron transfer DM13